MVGAIVVPGSDGSSWPSAGCSAAASATSAPRSPTGRPSSTSRVWSTTGSWTGVGHPGPDPGEQRRQVGDRVVADPGHRGVAGLAERDQPDRAGALLADRERRAPPGRRRSAQPGTAALVDRHRRPDVGPLLQQPAHADVRAAVLLVGDRDEPQVAPRPEALPRQRRHRDRPRRDLVLHVDGAAAPAASRRRRRPPRRAGASTPGRRRGPRRCGRRRPATARRGRSPGSAPPGWPATAPAPPAPPPRRRRPGGRAAARRPASRCPRCRGWSCRAGSARGSARRPRRRWRLRRSRPTRYDPEPGISVSGTWWTWSATYDDTHASPSASARSRLASS